MYPHNSTQLIALVALITIVVAIVIDRHLQRNTNSRPKAKRPVSLKKFSSYNISSNGETATVTLFKIKDEYRDIVRNDPDIVRIWLEIMNMSFPSLDDMIESQIATGLPTSYSIQSVIAPGRVCVLDIGHPTCNLSGKKQITCREEPVIGVDKFDLIAAIDKRFAKTPRQHKRSYRTVS